MKSGFIDYVTNKLENLVIRHIWILNTEEDLTKAKPFYVGGSPKIGDVILIKRFNEKDPENTQNAIEQERARNKFCFKDKNIRPCLMKGSVCLACPVKDECVKG